MGKFLTEFKEFAMKGNVVDMAVGVIIGGAFGKIVTSLVNDIIMPLVSVVTGGVNFTQNKIILKEAVKQGTEIINPEVAITWGVFIQSIVDFLIIAFCIFMAIRFMNKIKNATRGGGCRRGSGAHRGPETAHGDPRPAQDPGLRQEQRLTRASASARHLPHRIHGLGEIHPRACPGAESAGVRVYRP